jgi:hypothetical protein
MRRACPTGARSGLARRYGLAGPPGIFAYRRPDSPVAPRLTWDDFVLRRASLGAGA